MKTKSLVLIGTFTLLLLSCSSVKVLDKWESENIDAARKNNFLVVMRSTNNQARISFEQEIANLLRSKGIAATESYKKFPIVDLAKERTPEEMAQVKQIIENEGFNGIVVSSLVDYDESLVTTTSGNYYGSPGYYQGFYGYYGRPYYGYYNSAYIGSSTSTTQVSKKYVLETAVYNMLEPKERQLIAVVTSEVTDPSSAQSAADDYAAAIGKAFEKK